MTDRMTVLCRQPDGRGVLNPRCQEVIEEPRDQASPRQCRRAAKRGSRFCDAHQAAANPDTGDAHAHAHAHAREENA